jgi:hypothetical protein
MALHFKGERGVQYAGRVLRDRYVSDVRIMSDVWAGQYMLDCVEPDGSITSIAYMTEGFGGNPGLESWEIDATPEAIAQHEAWLAAREAERVELEARRARAIAAAEAKAVRKGRRCKVVRGRKVPKGTEGVCIWVGDGHYGERCGIKDDSGTVHWTASKNVEAIAP